MAMLRIARFKVPIDLSIENVPVALVEQLCRRAALSHRSLQAELMAILLEAVGGSRERLSILEAHQRVRDLGLRGPSEAAAMVREDRDSR